MSYLIFERHFLMKLRDYQQETIRLIDESTSNKILVHLSTGAGKSEIFCEILKQRGSGVLVVRGRSLVDNASQRLARHGIDHGVIMANHPRYDLGKPIQVCSIDTLIAREIFPPSDLLIIDEAHYAVSDSFKIIAPHYPKIISFTATPYVNQSLDHIADVVIRPVSHEKLVEQGYLVRGKYYAPSQVDLSRVKIVGGDYNLNDLDLAYSPKIYGEAVEWYTKLLAGRPAVCFAINKRHAQMMADRFKAGGYISAVVTDQTSLAERQKIIKDLESGSLHVAVNVNVFSVGVDIPCLAGVIVCRPTQSLNWHIQALGRGTRTFPGKDHFLVLDHANNTATHGFLEDEIPFTLKHLSNKIKRKTLRGMGAKICTNCFSAFRGTQCPICGFVKNVEKKIESREKTEIALQIAQGKATVGETQLNQEIKKLAMIARLRGFKPGWVYFKIKSKFGDAVAKRCWTKINAMLGGGS